MKRSDQYIVAPLAVHELMIMPQFGDSMEGDALVPSPEEGDWQVYDGVTEGGRSILDLFGGQNILKRRDATCKLIYSPVGKLGARKIFATPLYAAVEDCVQEFYQGDMIDYSNKNWEKFGAQIMPLMEKGVATDLYTNKYFGDTARPNDPTNVWSWNKFDGVFTQIAKYVGTGIIPEDQIFAITEGDITPSQANAALAAAYAAQPDLLDNMDDDEKAFYVDKKLALAYWAYQKAAGETTLVDRMSGLPILFYNGIAVKIKKWDAVLKALNGGIAAHAVILTIRGNFLYAANSTYGGGPFRNEAIRVWYSDDYDVWRRQLHVMAGTEIAAPQLIVFGITEF